MEIDTRLQGTFMCLLIYLFISKALRKERSSMFPKRGVHMETNIHLPYLTYLSGSTIREPSLQVHLMESTQTDAPFLESSFIQHSKSSGYEPHS